MLEVFQGRDQILAQKVRRSGRHLDRGFHIWLGERRFEVRACVGHNVRGLLLNGNDRTHPILKRREIALDVDVYVDRIRVAHRIFVI